MRAFFLVAGASLLLPSLIFAQPAKRDAWHVAQADIRYSVALDPNWLAPIEIHLADLPATESKDLTFDRITRAAKPREIGEKASGKSILRVKGSATFAIKPEYRWLSFRANGKVAIHLDNAPVTARLLPDKITHHLPIPAGARSIRLDVDSDNLAAAGFLTSGPKVARMVLCLPDLDPTQTTPIVYGDDGKQVGAVSLWAHPGEPMVVLFDSSAARPMYHVYPVDKKHNVVRPEWIPQAGLVLESRYFDHYDPKVKTLDGFLDLWKQSDHVACKLEETEILRSFLPATPLRDSASLKSAPRGAPLHLSRYVGHVRLPADDEYHFHLKVWPGGFLLVDGQPIIELTPAEANSLLVAPANQHRIVALKLSAGVHRIEVGHYGQHGQFLASLGLSTANSKQPRIVGQGYPIFEAVANVQLKELQHRDPDKLAVQFAWPYRGDRAWRQCLSQWPAEDLVDWHFSARSSAADENIEYRWRFDDGCVTKGKEIAHVFCRTGYRKVTLEAVDRQSEKVLAKSEGMIHVQIRPDWPEGHAFHLVVEDLKKRTAEFTSTMPIGELLNLHAWSCQYRRQDLRALIGEALAARIDEVIATAPSRRLLPLAMAFIEPEERRYAAAEKLLQSTLDRSALGSHSRRQAALALANLLTSHNGKPQEALDLLDKIGAEASEVDLVSGWKVAFDTTPRSNVSTLSPADVIPQLKWEPETKRLPLRYSAKESEGLWLMKDITLTDAAQKPLVIDLGDVASHLPSGAIPAPGMIWLNNQPVGEPWRSPLQAPPKLLRNGGNQIVVYVQAAAAPEFYRAPAVPAFDVLGAGRGEDLTPQFQRGRAEALAHLGKLGEAAKVLQELPAKSWPLGEIERVRLSGQLRIIQRLAAGGGDDPLNARDQLDALLSDYPLLRLDAEVMQGVVEAHLGLKEHQQALLLARQMLGVKEQSELTRRQLFLAQVRAAAGLNNFELARKIYKDLADFAPYSPETVRAREAIIRAAESNAKE